MSSPPLKHPRVEEENAFLPPQFHLPARPPISGFPDESDIVVAKVRGGSRSVDGKVLLLNASPTLELKTGEVGAFWAALQQHPTCAKIRGQLKKINSDYLEKIFGDEDAREDDTRRRVDFNAGCATLKSNSTKRLSMCVSSLTRGQHRHYRSWIINYMQTGVVPKETEEYPDMNIVMELVQREQAAYMHKFMEEIVSCEACKIEAGQRKRALEEENEGMLLTHSFCWNHNYMNEHVERFARRWWRYKLESRLLRCFRLAEMEDVGAGEKEEGALGKESDGSSNYGNVFCKVFFDNKKKSTELAEKVEKIRPSAAPTLRTRNFVADFTASLGAECELLEDSSSMTGTSISIPPTLLLAVEQLDERPPKLHIAAVDIAGQPDQKDEDKLTDLYAIHGEEPPPVHPVPSLPDVFFSLVVCKSALVELATAHLSVYRAGFHIPVRCTWHMSEKRVDICIEKPLPKDHESRRKINGAALKRLVNSDPRFPSNSCCYVRGNKCGGKCCSKISFGPDFSFHCVSNCTYDVRRHTPVFSMVKMEYNCKGYNTLPDDEEVLFYERFSKKETVYMWLILSCNPSAILYVYRINAYSNCVIGIEQFSFATFMSHAIGFWSNDVEVQRTWNSLCDMLQSIVFAVASRQQKLSLQQQEPSNESNKVKTLTFIIKKEMESSHLSLCSVKALYPQLTFSLDEAVESFIEPSSKAVCRREFFPPCVWPFSDRIPYTYGPAPKSCYLINRTTETRHPSEYYAKHDVLHHETHYYSVGDDGIIRERKPVK